MAASLPPFPIWLSPEGQPVACVEKIEVMHENLTGLHQMAQDAYRLGKGTILELIDALGSINEHRLEHLELVKDMLDAEWEVRLASCDLPQVRP